MPKLIVSTRVPNPPAMVLNPKNTDDYKDYKSKKGAPDVDIFIRNEYIEIPFFLFGQEENLTRPREEVLRLGIGVTDTVDMVRLWNNIIIPGLQTRPKVCQDVHLTEKHIAELIYRKVWPLTKKILTDLLNEYSIELQ